MVIHRFQVRGLPRFITRTGDQPKFKLCAVLRICYRASDDLRELVNRDATLKLEACADRCDINTAIRLSAMDGATRGVLHALERFELNTKRV
jgi:hypothetical protein